MAKVFRASVDFEDQRAELKEKIAAAEAIASSFQSKLEELQQQLELVESGSDDEKDLRRRHKAKTAEFEDYRREQSGKFLKAESTIYRGIYEMVAAEISKYSREHNIDLVMRANLGPIEETDPQKPLENLNRQVVYENGLDITDDIIAAINGK
jgi:Skp family chaperone for outer membrane proteins